MIASRLGSARNPSRLNSMEGSARRPAEPEVDLVFAALGPQVSAVGLASLGVDAQVQADKRLEQCGEQRSFVGHGLHDDCYLAHTLDHKLGAGELAAGENSH